MKAAKTDRPPLDHLDNWNQVYSVTKQDEIHELKRSNSMEEHYVEADEVKSIMEINERV